MTVPAAWGAAVIWAQQTWCPEGPQRRPRARLLHNSTLSCVLWEVFSGLSLRNVICKNVMETRWAGSEAERERRCPSPPLCPCSFLFLPWFGSSSQRAGSCPGALSVELSVGCVWPKVHSPPWRAPRRGGRHRCPRTLPSQQEPFSASWS